MPAVHTPIIASELSRILFAKPRDSQATSPLDVAVSPRGRVLAAPLTTHISGKRLATVTSAPYPLRLAKAGNVDGIAVVLDMSALRILSQPRRTRDLPTSPRV